MEPEADGSIGARWVTTLAVVALLVVPATAAVALARNRGERVAPLPPEVEVVQGAAATADFLAAFERSRTETYRIRQVTELQRAGAVALTSAVTIVQRPPDRLTRADDGSVDGVRDGRVVRCGEGQCYVGDPGFDYEAGVADQIENLTRLVSGAGAAYAVGAEPETRSGPAVECYLLDLLRQVPAPPYGTFARFCFDLDTGAPTLVRVEHPGRVDETVTEAQTAIVTHQDLALSDGG